MILLSGVLAKFVTSFINKNCLRFLPQKIEPAAEGESNFQQLKISLKNAITLFCPTNGKKKT